MMKRIGLNAGYNSKHLFTLLTALTLIFLGGVNKAYAQWTNPDASGNTNYQNGKVGIGTSTPNGKLDVYGGRIVVQPASTGSFMLINDPFGATQGFSRPLQAVTFT